MTENDPIVIIFLFFSSLPCLFLFPNWQVAQFDSRECQCSELPDWRKGGNKASCSFFFNQHTASLLFVFVSLKRSLSCAYFSSVLSRECKRINLLRLHPQHRHFLIYPERRLKRMNLKILIEKVSLLSCSSLRLFFLESFFFFVFFTCLLLSCFFRLGWWRRRSRRCSIMGWQLGWSSARKWIHSTTQAASQNRCCCGRFDFSFLIIARVSLSTSFSFFAVFPVASAAKPAVPSSAAKAPTASAAAPSSAPTVPSSSSSSSEMTEWPFWFHCCLLWHGPWSSRLPPLLLYSSEVFLSSQTALWSCCRRFLFNSFFSWAHCSFSSRRHLSLILLFFSCFEKRDARSIQAEEHARMKRTKESKVSTEMLLGARR